jgi:hypothetical protein
MVLMYLPDKAAALASLAACLAPGGVVLLGNITDEPVQLNHPDALAITQAGRPAIEQLGIFGLEHGLAPLLAGAGFRRRRPSWTNPANSASSSRSRAARNMLGGNRFSLS